jgi:hypothetical protein
MVNVVAHLTVAVLLLLFLPPLLYHLLLATAFQAAAYSFYCHNLSLPFLRHLTALGTDISRTWLLKLIFILVLLLLEAMLS